MLIDMTTKAIRILEENPKRKAIYQTLGDIEIVLGQTHLSGSIVVDATKEGLGLKVRPNHFVGEPFVTDLCDQLNYLIKCSPELNIPIEIRFN